MSESGGDESRQSDGLPLRLAFYLPQFHQTPENDAWHGVGFTEWTLVARSRPLFAGHYQPHLPGELGFYDLRLPETRELQARLARSYGISGFCYYHYWFRGRRMLERPFHEVLRSGKPDFPFCLCWANESWFRKWQGSVDEVVVEQAFDEEDDLEHIRWAIEAFKDPRYIRVKGRPLLTVYRPHSLPNPKRTVEIWRTECPRAGVPEPWIVGFETSGKVTDPAEIGFNASAEFVPHGVTDLRDTDGASSCVQAWQHAVRLREGRVRILGSARSTLDPLSLRLSWLGQRSSPSERGSVGLGGFDTRAVPRVVGVRHTKPDSQQRKRRRGVCQRLERVVGRRAP